MKCEPKEITSKLRKTKKIRDIGHPKKSELRRELVTSAANVMSWSYLFFNFFSIVGNSKILRIHFGSMSSKFRGSFVPCHYWVLDVLLSQNTYFFLISIEVLWARLSKISIRIRKVIKKGNTFTHDHVHIKKSSTTKTGNHPFRTST